MLAVKTMITVRFPLRLDSVIQLTAFGPRPNIIQPDIAHPAPPFVATIIPVPVSFPGMPPPRLWSVEERGANYGPLEPAPQDLARLVVVDFAIGSARDWLVVPFEVLAASVTPAAGSAPDPGRKGPAPGHMAAGTL